MNKIEMDEIGDTGMYFITTSKNDKVINGSIITEEHIRFIKEKNFDDIDKCKFGKIPLNDNNRFCK